MSNQNQITTTVNGITINGVFNHRSAADIEIEILEPYTGLKRSLHIPYFARPYRNFEGEQGAQAAEALLASLYEIATDVTLRRDHLRLLSDIYFKDNNLTDAVARNLFFEDCFELLIPLGTRDDVMELLK